MRPGSEADHSPPYVFMAWYLIKHRDILVTSKSYYRQVSDLKHRAEKMGLKVVIRECEATEVIRRPRGMACKNVSMAVCASYQIDHLSMQSWPCPHTSSYIINKQKLIVTQYQAGELPTSRDNSPSLSPSY
jgi:hypothetical protein